MKKYILPIGFLYVLLIACSSSNITDDRGLVEGHKKSIKKVLIIGIDGCRPDALTKAQTPNIDALIANGTYSLDARNTGKTISGPGWTAMLTGVWENKHGVIDNSFKGYNDINYPHLFKRIEDYNPNFKTVSVAQWNPINTKVVEGTADVSINALDTTKDVETKAIAQLADEDLTAMFVHFDDVDHAGHSTGFSLNNPNYIGAIQTVDQSIGAVVAALKKRKNYSNEDWIIMVSTDHGGISNNHGGNSDEERTIFVIVSGDSVPKKQISKTTSQKTVENSIGCLKNSKELQFSNDGFVEIPNTASHNFGLTQDFSIECRIKSDYAGDVSVLSKKNWDNGSLPGFIFSFKTNTQKFKVNVGDGSNRVDVESAILTDNQWHTLSATFDRDGMLKVYVDGIFSNEVSMASIKNIDNNLPLTIGADGNNKYGYNGSIEEVRVFNSLLSPEDISKWQCKPLDQSHSKYANLKGYWKLNDNSISILDSSPVRANGVLKGGNWTTVPAEKVVEVYNFDKTPRTVDLFKTALTHLCIPILDQWNLDGNSLIEKICTN